ncbi:unnamed protein product [Parnassius mnemosyne]|uniref:Integrase catalytic domain-containing protein n=1 Tax=Parnassius mnemosyne TaxID=213953 RepID=A0AAV1M274_9NEOP
MWPRFGLPKQVVSDNGPPFFSNEVKQFLSSNGIEQIFSAPYHPASNGAAENAVKWCKRNIKKAIKCRTDIHTSLCRFLLAYRNNPHYTTGESPKEAKMCIGHNLRMRLDCLKPDQKELVKAQQKHLLRERLDNLRQVRSGSLVWSFIYQIEEKLAHLKDKEETYERFQADQKIQDENILCVSFDLQKVLNTPYSQKLEKATVSWTETEGKRGANEVSTILENYIKMVDDCRDKYFKGNLTGKISKVRTATFKKPEPQKIIVKYTMATDNPVEEIEITNKNKNLQLKKIYKTRLPISKKKYQDLWKLCTSMIIPEMYHYEYENFPCAANVQDTLQDTDVEDIF